MTGPTVSITLLGGFAVEVDGQQVDSAEWRRRQAAAIVKVLALEPARSMHRERLLDVIWPGLDVETAAPRLHKAAHFARRALGKASSVVLDGDRVALFPDVEVTVDAVTFQQRAEHALETRDAADAGRVADTYGGDLLPDDPYEPWVERIRERLRHLQIDLLRLAERWMEVVELDPADEEAHVAIAKALADAGDRRAALRQLERLENELKHELGVAPSREALQLRTQLGDDVEQRHSDGIGVSRSVLVGRDKECAALVEALPSSRQRNGSVLFLSGPAGSGKTMLLQWLEEQATERDLAVGVGVAARVEGDWPYAPVLEALADLCRRHPELLDQLSVRLRAEIDEALSGRATRWDGQGAHQRLFVAVAELVRAAASNTGVVLIIDRAQQADLASLALLRYVARSITELPALIVVAHRGEVDRALADFRSGVSRSRVLSMDVGPLQREDALALARTVASSISGSAFGRVFEQSGGLAFGVLELARSWAQDPTADAPPRWLPPGLTDETTEVLSRCAVLGMTFDTDEMCAACGITDEVAYRVLDEGVAHRVLVRERATHSFRHPLIRDALLERLDDRAFADAHRSAAQAIADLGGSAARIGHHLVEAGDSEAAVSSLLSAAETEAAHGAYRDALAALERIAPVARGADRSRLLAMRADLLNACGDLGAVDAYREAIADAEVEARPRLLTRLARAAISNGDLSTAELALEEVELDGSDNDPELLLARGNLAYALQDYDAADAAAAEARRRISVSGERWQLFDLIALQGLLAHLRGEWFQRLRVELRNSVERPEVAVGIFDSHLCVAEYLLYGPTPYDEVLMLAEQLRASAKDAGVLRAVAFATALRGEAALLKGDLDLAEHELIDAVELHHDLESTAGEAHSLQRLAEVHLARGDKEGAESLLNRALPLARWSPIASHLLQRIYGTMILAARDAESAFSVVERAESTLANEDDCMLCTIMLDLPAARASADVGDHDRARAYLASAEVSADRWQGTAWHAGVVEIKGHLALSQGRNEEARRLFGEAAGIFESSGQPLDADRCKSALVSS
ncbi:MAG TPA: BREX system ATP-binding domain-containing protein [Actinomycetes bacterium]|nr:BREX system ATP-binding domain-containing protein [Actinomycetes bacterium]